MSEDKLNVWKVCHVEADTETVLLVAAIGERGARRLAMEHMYPNDGGNNWTITYWMKVRGCSVGAVLFRPDPPYVLYALNHRTGEMSS